MATLDRTERRSVAMTLITPSFLYICPVTSIPWLPNSMRRSANRSPQKMTCM